MLIRALMSTNLVAVPPDLPVAAVAELLASRGISAVPVLDAEGAPLGIVTEGDLIRRLAEQPQGPLDWFLGLFQDSTPLIQRFAKAHGATARDVMTATLVTVGAGEPAEAAAQLMQQHHIRRVLVTEAGKLVGVVSRADLLRAILRPTPTPAGEGTDATEIKRALLAAMRAQPWVDTFWVFPSVAGGTVTLHGYARSAEMRRGLVVLAQELPGVTAVEDRMAPMPLILRATL